MLAIKKTNYMRYSSGNYGAHCIKLRIGNLTLWFSYDTVVAFREDSHLRCVSKNLWGPTTGKHLNAIGGGDKKNRLSREEFEGQLNDVLIAHGLIIKQ